MNYKCCFELLTLKKLFALCLLSIALNNARSQNPILLECMNINKAYLNTPYLSFNINYKYSYEATPNTIEDSSQAVFKVNGHKYWGKIDSVELLQSDSFNITVFKQDYIISLGLPTYNFNQSLPLAQWDSLFFQNERFSFTTGVDSIWKKITVDYDADLPYKKFEMWYDSVTYRISRMKYVVSEFAAEKDFYALESPGAYGIVDMQFSNYQTGQFGDSVFNPWVYIAYVEGYYVAANEPYQLYISSPGLLK